MKHQQKALLGLLACGALALSACGQSVQSMALAPSTSAFSSPSSGGETAGTTSEPWTLLDSSKITKDSTTLHIQVNHGTCGTSSSPKVLEPRVQIRSDRVTIESVAESVPNGDAMCAMLQYVPLTVTLPEPIGNREVVDGACLDPSEDQSYFCTDGAVRWHP